MTEMCIRERLMKHLKDEIIDAAARLGLDRLRKNAKKAEWAAYIEEELPKRLFNILLQMRAEDYAALRDCVQETGASIAKAEAESSASLYIALCVLERYGIAWQEQQAWRLDDYALKLLEQDEALLDDMKANDLLYDVMEGWLLHLGMMPVDDLLDRVAMHPEQTEEENMRERDICFTILSAREGPGSFFLDDSGNDWVIHVDVDDPMRLCMRIRSKNIAALPYPEFDLNMLIRSQRVLGVPGEPALYRPLSDWLYDRNHMDDDTLADTLETVVYLIQNGDTGEAMDFLFETAQPRNEKDARRGMEVLTQLINRIPLWDNKGYSAREMAQLLARSGAPKMPGRNDRCTCGSGKKYKDCCGRRVN